ncbi:MAG: ORF6N domain-containing protein, partial [Prevotella sp.]|nr:ORF6N domain-containing protein [Prevotella sp.]
MKDLMKLETVQDKIVKLRGQSVMLDYAVADLYGVETKRIN